MKEESEDTIKFDSQEELAAYCKERKEEARKGLESIPGFENRQSIIDLENAADTIVIDDDKSDNFMINLGIPEGLDNKFHKYLQGMHSSIMNTPETKSNSIKTFYTSMTKKELAILVLVLGDTLHQMHQHSQLQQMSKMLNSIMGGRGSGKMPDDLSQLLRGNG